MNETGKEKVVPLRPKKDLRQSGPMVPEGRRQAYEIRPEEVEPEYRAFARIADSLLKLGPASYNPENIAQRIPSGSLQDLLELVGKPENRMPSMRHALAERISDELAARNNALKPVPKNVLAVVNAYNAAFRPHIPALTPPARYNPELEQKQLKTIARARLILKKVREKQPLTENELARGRLFLIKEDEVSLAVAIHKYNIETMDNPSSAAAMAKQYLDILGMPEEG